MAALQQLTTNFASINDAINQLINSINTLPGGANSASGLPIAQGGTGAITAALARSGLGIGTIATQASNAVALTGGTIDGITIGGTTPGAGTFTTLTGNTSITTPTLSASNTSGQGTLAVNSQTASGFGGFIKLQSGGGNQAYVGLDSGINGGTNYGQLTLQTVSGNINLQPTGGLVLVNTATLIGSSVALTNGAAAQTATLTNGPTAGNPTKWIPISDNGTTRYIPAW